MTPAERRAEVRLRDRIAASLTYHIRPLYRLRAAWATRKTRPGFRASDYR